MRFTKSYCTHCRINGDKAAAGRAAMYQKSFRHRLRERCVILAAGCIGFTTPLGGYVGGTRRRWWRRTLSSSSSPSPTVAAAAAAIARRRNPFSLYHPSRAPLPLSVAIALSCRRSRPSPPRRSFTPPTRGQRHRVPPFTP